MNINFELYKIFYQVAIKQSFSEAAKELFITQSAVSQSIKNLETELGVTLFFRKGRGSELTSEGKLLFSHIDQAYNFIKNAEFKIHELQNFGLGDIRIGVSDTVCKYFLLPYLQRFNANYPNIGIQVINRTSEQILSLLEKGSVDCGIVTLPVENRKFSVTEIATLQDIWVAAPTLPHIRTEMELKDLMKFPLLLLEKKSATRRLLDLFLAQKGIDINPRIELESVELLVEFAKINLGVAHVLKESAADAIADGKLITIQTEHHLPQRNLGIVTMERLPMSHTTVAFVKMLTENRELA